MINLSHPENDFESTILNCHSGITGNPELSNKLNASITELLAGGDQFIFHATTNTLFEIQALPTHTSSASTVVSSLTKSDLIKLYDQYMAKSGKPGRQIYDAILNAALDQCPYCGGIGSPKNLDHYLPKANFPQFSVHPLNLIPACRDCNSENKGSRYALSEEEQILQPYTDKDHFFSEQWIYATYLHDNDGEPGWFEYFVSTPTSWAPADAERAQRHFDTFDLGERYAKQAARELKAALSQIDLAGQFMPIDEVKHSILKPRIDTAPFPNYWQCGMYQALISSL